MSQAGITGPHDGPTRQVLLVDHVTEEETEAQRGLQWAEDPLSQHPGPRSRKSGFSPCPSPDVVLPARG